MCLHVLLLLNQGTLYELHEVQLLRQTEALPRLEDLDISLLPCD